MKQCLIVSDFNVSNLQTILNGHSSDAPHWAATQYAQVYQVLIDGSMPCWTPSPDCVLVWTRPEAVLKPFAELVLSGCCDDQALIAAVDEFAAFVACAAPRAKITLVVTWHHLPHARAFGLLNSNPTCGIQHALARANLRLMERLGNAPGVKVLWPDSWMVSDAWDSRLWYTAKIPFRHNTFIRAARDIQAALHVVEGKAKKLVIIDLDNTLWGGVLGDVGWQGLQIGGHHHIGESFRDFQFALKQLGSRGVLLAIASKNDETLALEAITKHPEMVLRTEDFAAWRINWNDKAQNVLDIVHELNLGPDSAVFVDDSPIERARVREAIPDVLVPEWPNSTFQFAQTLLDLDCFNSFALSGEDRSRTAAYQAERARRRAQLAAPSLQDWLGRLGTKVEIQQLSPASFDRTLQLLNKTNQLNLSTRRFVALQLAALADNPDWSLWTVSLTDKFGDYGLVGFISLELAPPEARLIDFVLSCRAMGRNVEETMLYWAVRVAALTCNTVRAEYVPTARNKPCLDLFCRSGWRHADENVFTWPIGKACPLPECVELTGSETEFACSVVRSVQQ